MSDQHITAIATIVQDFLLLASAGLIAWYLWETRKMRKAAENQVTRSQELVAAAQRQVDASLEQVEAGSRPAVVAKAGPGSLARPFLVNIGNGPAIELRWSVPNSNHTGTVPYLEARHQSDELFDIKVLYNAALQTTPNAAGIECRYRSLSGRSYSSSNAYDFDRERFITAFADDGLAGGGPSKS